MRENLMIMFGNPNMTSYEYSFVNRMLDNANISIDTGCLVSNYREDEQGYTRVEFKSKSVRLHRIAFSIARKTTLGPHQMVRHLCHNKKCFNPGHLELGDQKANMEDNRIKWMNLKLSGKEKKCNKCLQSLPVEAFSKLRRSKDGLDTNCRDCKSIAVMVRSNVHAKPTTADLYQRILNIGWRITDRGCYIFPQIERHGYGVFSYNYKTYRAHRVVAEYFYKKVIPTDKVVSHLCHNRACVNPSHLKVTTQSDNILHSVESNRIGKLSGEDVAAMRKEYSTGMYTTLTLGKKYGVSDSVVNRALIGESYKHVLVPPPLTKEEMKRIRYQIKERKYHGA